MHLKCTENNRCSKSQIHHRKRILAITKRSACSYTCTRLFEDPPAGNERPTGKLAIVKLSTLASYDVQMRTPGSGPVDS